MHPPLLAVSLGCPAGIGPEVAVRAAAELRAARCVLVGDPAVVRAAAELRAVSLRRLVPVASRREMDRLGPREIGVFACGAALGQAAVPGKPDGAAGAAQLRWIDRACDLVLSGACDALVTGPVSKAHVVASGAPGARRFRGHTEHLARRTGAAEVIMAFRSQKLTTALVTTHLPLHAVPGAITPGAVARACFWLADLLARLGASRPRVAVAGLNPHAGESGLLGSEEQTGIVPGMRAARVRLRRAGSAAELVGPVGAETAFRLAAAGAYDGVVAMYHDQATIACKLLGFGEAVNVTLGLPIVRTSVDHGTAYDLAGTGRASARGMRSAMELATLLVAGPRASRH
ncbi:MAG: 4-hydroxythreonine-4-phosphate dehydrogenase PdxA [Deltaproteobacteria bacterium]|nr:4-hydroxythreonine-4-phosphate dehydrogenase PdxA [Deltaproteobacteria bacterium]